jgi:sn-glycerol 3-phosphate transport system ATP-binding protein
MGCHLDQNVVKRYGKGATANQVIHGVNAEIADGEFIVIVGLRAAASRRCCAWSRAWKNLRRTDLHFGPRGE